MTMHFLSQTLVRAVGAALPLYAGVALLATPASGDPADCHSNLSACGSGCSAARPGHSDTAPPPATQALEEQWGIEVSSLRVSSNGMMVDFRYKVLDPQKAATLGDPRSRPYLMDEATGRKLLVPNTPKVGPLRQTAEQLKQGRIYFALFSNPGRMVKPGSKVTVVIGDFRVEHLTVE